MSPLYCTCGMVLVCVQVIGRTTTGGSAGSGVEMETTGGVGAEVAATCRAVVAVDETGTAGRCV
jgi:hypothetical protein